MSLITSSNGEYDALLYRIHYNKLAQIQRVSLGGVQVQSFDVYFVYFLFKGERGSVSVLLRKRIPSDQNGPQSARQRNAI